MLALGADNSRGHGKGSGANPGTQGPGLGAAPCGAAPGSGHSRRSGSISGPVPEHPAVPAGAMGQSRWVRGGQDSSPDVGIGVPPPRERSRAPRDTKSLLGREGRSGAGGIPREGAERGGSEGRGRQSPPRETRATGSPGREGRSCPPLGGVDFVYGNKSGDAPNPDTALLLFCRSHRAERSPRPLRGAFGEG